MSPDADFVITREAKYDIPIAIGSTIYGKFYYLYNDLMFFQLKNVKKQKTSALQYYLISNSY